MRREAEQQSNSVSEPVKWVETLVGGGEGSGGRAIDDDGALERAHTLVGLYRYFLPCAHKVHNVCRVSTPTKRLGAAAEPRPGTLSSIDVAANSIGIPQIVEICSVRACWRTVQVKCWLLYRVDDGFAASQHIQGHMKTSVQHFCLE